MVLGESTTDAAEEDLESLPDRPELPGIFGLWLRITCLCVSELLHGRFSTTAAEEFIMDPENIFFEYVAEELGFTPEALREKIIAAARQGHHGAIKTPDGG